METYLSWILRASNCSILRNFMVINSLVVWNSPLVSIYTTEISNWHKSMLWVLDTQLLRRDVNTVRTDAECKEQFLLQQWIPVEHQLTNWYIGQTVSLQPDAGIEINKFKALVILHWVWKLSWCTEYLPFCYRIWHFRERRKFDFCSNLQYNWAPI